MASGVFPQQWGTEPDGGIKIAMHHSDVFGVIRVSYASLILVITDVKYYAKFDKKELYMLPIKFNFMPSVISLKLYNNRLVVLWEDTEYKRYIQTFRLFVGNGTNLDNLLITSPKIETLSNGYSEPCAPLSEPYRISSSGQELKCIITPDKHFTPLVILCNGHTDIIQPESNSTTYTQQQDNTLSAASNAPSGNTNKGAKNGKNGTAYSNLPVTQNQVQSLGTNNKEENMICETQQNAIVAGASLSSQPYNDLKNNVNGSVTTNGNFNNNANNGNIGKDKRNDNFKYDGPTHPTFTSSAPVKKRMQHNFSSVMASSDIYYLINKHDTLSIISSKNVVANNLERSKDIDNSIVFFFVIYSDTLSLMYGRNKNGELERMQQIKIEHNSEIITNYISQKTNFLFSDCETCTIWEVVDDNVARTGSTTGKFLNIPGNNKEKYSGGKRKSDENTEKNLKKASNGKQSLLSSLNLSQKKKATIKLNMFLGSYLAPCCILNILMIFDSLQNIDQFKISFVYQQVSLNGIENKIQLDTNAWMGGLVDGVFLGRRNRNYDDNNVELIGLCSGLEGKVVHIAKSLYVKNITKVFFNGSTPAVKQISKKKMKVQEPSAINKLFSYRNMCIVDNNNIQTYEAQGSLKTEFLEGHHLFKNLYLVKSIGQPMILSIKKVEATLENINQFDDYENQNIGGENNDNTNSYEKEENEMNLKDGKKLGDEDNTGDNNQKNIEMKPNTEIVASQEADDDNDDDTKDTYFELEEHNTMRQQGEFEYRIEIISTPPNITKHWQNSIAFYGIQEISVKKKKGLYSGYTGYHFINITPDGLQLFDKTGSSILDTVKLSNNIVNSYSYELAPSYKESRFNTKHPIFTSCVFIQTLTELLAIYILNSKICVVPLIDKKKSSIIHKVKGVEYNSFSNGNDKDLKANNGKYDFNEENILNKADGQSNFSQNTSHSIDYEPSVEILCSHFNIHTNILYVGYDDRIDIYKLDYKKPTSSSHSNSVTKISKNTKFYTDIIKQSIQYYMVKYNHSENVITTIFVTSIYCNDYSVPSLMIDNESSTLLCTSVMGGILVYSFDPEFNKYEKINYNKAIHLEEEKNIGEKDVTSENIASSLSETAQEEEDISDSDNKDIENYINEKQKLVNGKEPNKKRAISKTSDNHTSVSSPYVLRLVTGKDTTEKNIDKNESMDSSQNDTAKKILLPSHNVKYQFNVEDYISYEKIYLPLPYNYTDVLNIKYMDDNFYVITDNTLKRIDFYIYPEVNNSRPYIVLKNVLTGVNNCMEFYETRNKFDLLNRRDEKFPTKCVVLGKSVKLISVLNKEILRSRVIFQKRGVLWKNIAKIEPKLLSNINCSLSESIKRHEWQVGTKSVLDNRNFGETDNNFYVIVGFDVENNRGVVKLLDLDHIGMMTLKGSTDIIQGSISFNDPFPDVGETSSMKYFGIGEIPTSVCWSGDTLFVGTSKCALYGNSYSNNINITNAGNISNQNLGNQGITNNITNNGTANTILNPNNASAVGNREIDINNGHRGNRNIPGAAGILDNNNNNNNNDNNINSNNNNENNTTRGTGQYMRTDISSQYPSQLYNNFGNNPLFNSVYSQGSVAPLSQSQSFNPFPQITGTQINPQSLNTDWEGSSFINDLMNNNGNGNVGINTKSDGGLNTQAIEGGYRIGLINRESTNINGRNNNPSLLPPSIMDIGNQNYSNAINNRTRSSRTYENNVDISDFITMDYHVGSSMEGARMTPTFYQFQNPSSAPILLTNITNKNAVEHGIIYAFNIRNNSLLSVSSINIEGVPTAIAPLQDQPVDSALVCTGSTIESISRQNRSLIISQIPWLGRSRGITVTTTCIDSKFLEGSNHRQLLTICTGDVLSGVTLHNEEVTASEFNSRFTVDVKITTPGGDVIILASDSARQVSVLRQHDRRLREVGRVYVGEQINKIIPNADGTEALLLGIEGGIYRLRQEPESTYRELLSRVQGGGNRGVVDRRLL